MNLKIDYIMPFIATIFAIPHTYYATLPFNSSFVLFIILFVLFLTGLILIITASPREIKIVDFRNIE